MKFNKFYVSSMFSPIFKKENMNMKKTSHNAFKKIKSIKMSDY